MTYGDIIEENDFQELDLMPVGPIEHVTKYERDKENLNYNMRGSRSRERHHYDHPIKWKQGSDS
jgi:hypothetical protein